jgi:hypothetical protein
MHRRRLAPNEPRLRFPVFSENVHDEVETLGVVMRAPSRRRVLAMLMACLTVIVIIVVSTVVGVSETLLASSHATAAAVLASVTTGVPTPAPTGSTSLTTSSDITLSVACNEALSGADAGFCLAFFSYQTTAPFDVPLGANNYMTPGPVHASHPTYFHGGLQYGAVISRWACSEVSSLSWVVRTESGTAVATTTAENQPCLPLGDLF